MEWKISAEPVPYEEAVAFMENQVQAIIAGTADEMVWLLEHPPLFTAGSSAKDSDLLDTMGFPVYKTGRGGQYTYHGPGQRITYVMLDLRTRRQDVRWYVGQLEQWIIATLACSGIKGEIREGRVGVWVKMREEKETQSAGRSGNNHNNESKIAALGVRLKHWVTYHGIAININPDLTHYKGIVPCGISEYGVTSYAALGVPRTMSEIDAQLKQTLGNFFK